MNNTTIIIPSKFGRLDWNVNITVLEYIGPPVTVLNYVGTAIEITILIVLLNQFVKKEGYFKSAFFVIYFVGCLVDVIQKTVNIALTIYVAFVKIDGFNKTHPLQVAVQFATYYLENFAGPWHLIIALNRFSALVFWIKYKQIWSRYSTAVICFILLIYPFLQDIHCPQYIWNQLVSTLQSPESKACNTVIYDVKFILDVIYSISSSLITFSAALYLIINKESFKNHGSEVSLLMQSLFTSIAYTLTVIIRWFSSQNSPDFPLTSETFNEYMRLSFLGLFFLRISHFLYIFYHYAGCLILIVFAKSFRTVYFSFYGSIFKFLRLPRPNKVVVIQGSVTQPGTNLTVSQISL